MSTQDAFLSRVRRALQVQGHASQAELALPESAPESAETIRSRLRPQRAALVARLQDELRAVGGQVVRAESVAEATQYVTQLAREYEAELVVRWDDALLEMLEVDAALQEQGVEVSPAAPPLEDAAAMAEQRDHLRELLARADIGLSGADFVIAETGTLALSTLPGQMRGVSLLPPVHVAVVKHSQIVESMADCLAMLQDEGQVDIQERLTSCVSFITGPSRTGDIELSLTVGVHGPGELHLIILDDPSDTDI
ncbi:MAG: lactate utilization protein B/C [Candidatus Entotheonella factor]|uniref:Lactate utilization protein B/C n=1 Tax=Entotheonella factor TaxID=1429438 RepID=W4LR36_ENTF1|nr:MAG: lactate utilization protein B/C [Candidatus Entotheonella factor]